MLARQRTGGPLVGNLAIMPDSRQTASRWGPSHCGQSSANNVLPPRMPAQNTPKLKLQIGCIGATYTTGRFSAMWKGRSPKANGFDSRGRPTVRSGRGGAVARILAERGPPPFPGAKTQEIPRGIEMADRRSGERLPAWEP